MRIDRLLDIATPANRDFVDERLGKIRARKQDLEARLADLGRVDYQPVDLEAATRDALAYLGRFREVLEQGLAGAAEGVPTGFVAGIEIDPDAARGTITCYELPAGSLIMVPGPESLIIAGPEMGSRSSWHSVHGTRVEHRGEAAQRSI